jgi:hypothetical protein
VAWAAVEQRFLAIEHASCNAIADAHSSASVSATSAECDVSSFDATLSIEMTSLDIRMLWAPVYRARYCVAGVWYSFYVNGQTGVCEVVGVVVPLNATIDSRDDMRGVCVCVCVCACVCVCGVRVAWRSSGKAHGIIPSALPPLMNTIFRYMGQEYVENVCCVSSVWLKRIEQLGSLEVNTMATNLQEVDIVTGATLNDLEKTNRYQIRGVYLTFPPSHTRLFGMAKSQVCVQVWSNKYGLCVTHASAHAGLDSPVP